MSQGASVLEAPAKINLVLRVLDRRLDGYHELRTVFQAIALFDRLKIEARSDGVTLEVRGADVGPVEDNLVYRAASRLLEVSDERLGVSIELDKHVPAGAGLGGGSSDAASTLLGVNELLERPLDLQALVRIGGELGSDVPFFLGSSTTALGRGRGEVIHPLPQLPPRPMVLVVPPVHVATGAAYGALADHRASGDRPSPTWAESAEGVIGTVEDWDDVMHSACNDFEAVVPALYPEVAQALSVLRGVDPDVAMLSGSGGACFGIFRDQAAAEAAAALASKQLGWRVVATTTLGRFPGHAG